MFRTIRMFDEIIACASFVGKAASEEFPIVVVGCDLCHLMSLRQSLIRRAGLSDHSVGCLSELDAIIDDALIIFVNYQHFDLFERDRTYVMEVFVDDRAYQYYGFSIANGGSDVFIRA